MIDDQRRFRGVKAFWHICCIGHWQHVCIEQMRVCKHADINEITACVLGDPNDLNWLGREADRRGLEIDFAHISRDITVWEGPTINVLWDFCKTHAGWAIIYFHSKGVTEPTNESKQVWRRIMMKYTVAWWKRNLSILTTRNACGVNWRTDQEFSPKWPHFQGNFWMATSDYLATLEKPSEYRKRHPGLMWGGTPGHSWTERMYVETWIGSGNPIISSFCGMDIDIWNPEVQKRFDITIPGFSYELGYISNC